MRLLCAIHQGESQENIYPWIPAHNAFQPLFAAGRQSPDHGPGAAWIKAMKLLLGLALLIGSALLYKMHFAGGPGELEGRWSIVSPPEGWKKIPGMDVMVTPDEIQIRAGTVVTTKLRYTIDSAARTVDAVRGDEAPRRGIYRLDGDMLTLCMGAPGSPRPETPDSTGDGLTKWVLRRGAQL